ncbi:hypothetical protein [Ewingella americana]|uniref:Uncharacterized protein n=1 Tax=Ewingella americana TaxID=41202 RepID=A0A502GKT8_9GAMM|nr:hypothetical protein [Ewingella americana]TPG62749.1 hypothetical protein EAH77_09765 [Ewingella americana]
MANFYGYILGFFILLGLKDLVELKEFAKLRSSYYEFTSEINVWVLIWYSKGIRMGHASMFIGHLDNESNYVSWRPNIAGGRVLLHKYQAAVANNYEIDYGIERRGPDVLYGVKSLNSSAMRKTWREICHKKDHPSFHAISKNGACIVNRILKTGLANSHLRDKKFGFMVDRFSISTPKQIAAVCNTLRDNNMALKIRIE